MLFNRATATLPEKSSTLAFAYGKRQDMRLRQATGHERLEAQWASRPAATLLPLASLCRKAYVVYGGQRSAAFADLTNYAWQDVD